MSKNDPISVADFCNFNKKFEQITLRPGAVMGKEIAQPGLLKEVKLSSRAAAGRDYAEPYIESDKRSLLEGHSLDLPGRSFPSLCEMEDLTSVGSVPNLDDVESENSLKVYDIYNFTEKKTDLSIDKKRKLIVQMVETNQVLIILGSTGCGKTTQVPQFILDDHAKKRKRCNIVITQPRRIAATSLAGRVCFERGWTLGTIVGYQIGLDNQTSSDTRLTYCSTGVLREKLVRERNMMDYTHVIIDEVHERDIETDFLLLIVRQLLRTNSRTVKVILMSATIDPAHFANYFSLPIGDRLYPAPVLEIEKNTNYKVDVYYINQLTELGSIPTFEFDEPQIHDDAMEIAIRLIIHLDKLDPKDCKVKNEKPSVLVFLPGIHEIQAMHDSLMKKVGENGKKYNWHVIPLHSSISKKEQMTVFIKPSQGFRKIILSTNIAESSITVPDIVYVIDFCLTKHLICDPVTNLTSLRYAWAAHSNCKQRAGRSGRLRCGRVYRMVPQLFYEEKLPMESDPEMVRCPLTQTVLKTKLLKMGEPKAILARALDPPDLTRLETTILLLKEAGALLMTSKGKFSKFDGDLTFLGYIMSCLPLDIHLSKLIMLGNVFSILEDTIIMAGWMTVRNVFTNSFYDGLGSYAAKISFTGSSCSDSITFLHVYHMYREKLRTNYFNTSNDSEKRWCERNFLNYKAMKEALELVDELRKRLKNQGVYEMVAEGKTKWSELDLSLIRKVVIAGAFYPNYFVRSALGGQVNEQDAFKVLAGKDPFTTVYLQGLPPQQPGELYAKTIKDIVETYVGGMVSNISFDGSSKVYIEFERAYDKKLPGKIAYPVYHAIKMRQSKVPIEIPILPVEEARKRMEKLGLVSNKYLCIGKLKATTKSRLPGLTDHLIEFVPSYVEDPHNFWIHRDEDSAELVSVQIKLNTPGNTSPLSGKLKVGLIYAAPYPKNSNALYRAQINAIRKDEATVLFIDYGNVDTSMPIKLISELEPIIQDLKSINLVQPFALPCTLTKISASLFKNESGIWSEEAINIFNNFLSVGTMIGEVFSVVDGRSSLTVKQRKNNKSVNEMLIESGLAVESEEDYRSKLDNNRRYNVKDYSKSNSTKESPQQSQQIDIDDIDHNIHKVVNYVDPPSRQDCKKLVRLRGPLSPLEMKVYGCVQVTMGKEVSMDVESVNAVLLDSYPEDPHERLLVAGFVSTNASSSRLKLGHTTLMPPKLGLSSLLCLIFTPTVELRLSKDKRRYIGGLCGLGYDKKTGESYFPENEMEVTFDCLIDAEDLLNVNKLRFWMSKPLASAEGSNMCDATPNEIFKAQQRVHDLLTELLAKQRPSQEVELFPFPYEWAKYDLMEAGFDDDRAVYKAHYALVIKD